MKRMSKENMMYVNGGGTAKSEPCPWCGRVFKRFYLGKYWKAYAMGRVAIDLRTHMYNCCLEYC